MENKGEDLNSDDDDDDVVDMDDFMQVVDKREDELEIQKAKEQALLYLSQNE